MSFISSTLSWRGIEDCSGVCCMFCVLAPSVAECRGHGLGSQSARSPASMRCAIGVCRYAEGCGDGDCDCDLLKLSKNDCEWAGCCSANPEDRASSRSFELKAATSCCSRTRCARRTSSFTASALLFGDIHHSFDATALLFVTCHQAAGKRKSLDF
jgi:hypothetical protein